ncbi:MAG: hypothetical protein G3M70_15245 [Candidatus Nitronauta litoralis]|uniref:Uncharacterized protein n=1 Tax=Candidatus Nitronauta litoralis TaxID=2705533 RepID=A0A7T0BYF5_9BACT|nr:MAG: hypothetical protein G3M70_15245 [Candidatus Nitronauta litoralis]
MLHETLNYFFIWGKDVDKLPINYGMFSLKGDKAVANVINKFLSTAVPSVAIGGIPVGQARFDILQDESFKTPGGNYYDLFIGHIEKPLPSNPLPDYFFEPGNYDS